MWHMISYGYRPCITFAQTMYSSRLSKSEYFTPSLMVNLSSENESMNYSQNALSQYVIDNVDNPFKNQQHYC